MGAIIGLAMLFGPAALAQTFTPSEESPEEFPAGAGRDIRARRSRRKSVASFEARSLSSAKRSSVQASFPALGLAPLASQNQPIQ
jgi:hypothetical protein